MSIIVDRVHHHGPKQPLLLIMKLMKTMKMDTPLHHQMMGKRHSQTLSVSEKMIINTR